MGEVKSVEIAHCADAGKEALLGFWMPGNTVDANNEKKMRQALATFSTLRLERIMNGAGQNAEIRGQLAHELDLPLSSEGAISDLTNTTVCHCADPEKDAILKFWMPADVVNDANEQQLRSALATLSKQRLEAIMNGKENEEVRSKLAKQAGLLPN